MIYWIKLDLPTETAALNGRYTAAFVSVIGSTSCQSTISVVQPNVEFCWLSRRSGTRCEPPQKKSPLTYLVSRTCRWSSSTTALAQCSEFSHYARPGTKPYTNASPPTVLGRRALPPDSLFYVVGPPRRPRKHKLNTLTCFPFPPAQPGKSAFSLFHICPVLLSSVSHSVRSN